MGKRRLSDFEDRLQRLIEGGFARLFRGPLHPREVATQLARAIEDNIITNAEGHELAPTQYLVKLSPADHTEFLEQSSDTANLLAQEVINYCQQSNLNLTVPPEVILLADPEIPNHDLRIDARHIISKRETTQILDRVALPITQPPTDAQLIVDGQRAVPLTQAIFNIGRHPDNDLVISDLRISRHHLQIRLRHGRYFLYDTHSRGGTYVNGQRVDEHMLATGDVIRLGGVSLLYMEEDKPDITDTQLDLIPPDLPEGTNRE